MQQWGLPINLANTSPLSVRQKFIVIIYAAVSWPKNFIVPFHLVEHSHIKITESERAYKFPIKLSNTSPSIPLAKCYYNHLL